mmetsp:Transcript_98986/g.171546  ORF Transcript_98986/g.171546 Transcript_98986/m.171546 type:complete len:80 (+) Transcript_98986:1142-1381(+)
MVCTKSAAMFFNALKMFPALALKSQKPSPKVSCQGFRWDESRIHAILSNVTIIHRRPWREDDSGHDRLIASSSKQPKKI